jgi:hypothetical protein
MVPSSNSSSNLLEEQDWGKYLRRVAYNFTVTFIISGILKTFAFLTILIYKNHYKKFLLSLATQNILQLQFPVSLAIFKKKGDQNKGSPTAIINRIN